MKIFAIKDETDLNQKVLAWLIYYEQAKRFYIELPSDADVWETPLLLSSFLKRGERTINAYWSEQWVRQRIVPQDRQNLGIILKENGLREYDEFQLLKLASGRCAQDDYYLEELQELPSELTDRFEKKIEDVIPLREKYVLAFFRNGQVKKYNAGNYFDGKPEFSPLCANEKLFWDVSVLPGGYGIGWGERQTIPDTELFANGLDIPLSLDDFLSFIRIRVVNSKEAEELLGCSRQNIRDLVKRGKLHPVLNTPKNTLFLKSEIEERMYFDQ